MTYKKPIRSEDTPFICGFRTAERISGRFNADDPLVLILKQLLQVAEKKHGISFKDTDWIGFKADQFEHFFTMNKIENYAAKRVEDYSGTGYIELICCVS